MTALRIFFPTVDVAGDGEFGCGVQMMSLNCSCDVLEEFVEEVELN